MDGLEKFYFYNCFLQRRCDKGLQRRIDVSVAIQATMDGFVSILIEQVEAISKRKSYEGTLVELIESSGFRG